MSKKSAEVRNVALVIYPAWIYYRRKLLHSVGPQAPGEDVAAEHLSRGDKSPRGERSEISRARTGFLALVADIISGENPMQGAKATPSSGAQSPSLSTGGDVIARMLDAFGQILGDDE